MADKQSLSLSHGDRAGHAHNIEIEYRMGLANVEPERTKLNVNLVDDEIRDVYAELFGAAVDEYNRKQQRDDRKIADYLEKVAEAKKEKVGYELVAQVGNRMTNSAKLPGNREKSEAIYRDFLDMFREEFPNLRIYQATIHHDEYTPHLHVAYVPWATGYKNGMSVRNSLTKAHKAMGYEDVRDVNARMYELLQMAAARHGVERLDMACNRGRYSVRDFKAMAEEIAKEEVYPYDNDPALIESNLMMRDLCRQYQEVVDKQNAMLDDFIQAEVSMRKLKELRELQERAETVREESGALAKGLHDASDALKRALERFREVWRDHVVNPVSEALSAAREKAPKLIRIKDGEGVPEIPQRGATFAAGGYRAKDVRKPMTPGEKEKLARSQADRIPDPRFRRSGRGR